MRNVCNERNERDERDGVNGASREPSCIKIYIRQNITFADGVASFLRAVPSLLRAAGKTHEPKTINQVISTLSLFFIFIRNKFAI